MVRESVRTCARRLRISCGLKIASLTMRMERYNHGRRTNATKNKHPKIQSYSEPKKTSRRINQPYWTRNGAGRHPSHNPSNRWPRRSTKSISRSKPHCVPDWNTHGGRVNIYSERGSSVVMENGCRG